MASLSRRATKAQTAKEENTVVVMVIGITAMLGFVALWLGVIVLRYVEDVLEWIAPRQHHPLEWFVQGGYDGLALSN